MRHSFHLRLVGVAAAVVVAAFALQGFGTAPAEATSPGANGRIAFIRGMPQDPFPSIYSVSPDGTRVKKLVSWASDPAWSPTGTQLAYNSYKTAEAQHAFWIMKADGSGLHQITHPDADHNDAAPTWSPDGSEIAFVRSRGDASTFDLWIVNADGTGPGQATTGVMVGHPTWSPRGDEIAFTRFGPGYTYPSSIWVINADGTGLGQISPAAQSARGASWSARASAARPQTSTRGTSAR